MNQEKYGIAADINECHRVRMERKKEVVDQKIQEAQRKAGVIVVITGNGKGKSSSGFGMVIRAMDHGMKVGVVQFIKGAMSTGEKNFCNVFPKKGCSSPARIFRIPRYLNWRAPHRPACS